MSHLTFAYTGTFSVCAQFPEGSAEMKEAKHLLRLKARDNARTPMQWDYTANGGFCPKGVKPWMRVNDDYPDVNAALQTSAGHANDRSMLVSPYRFWQRSIEARKKCADLLIYGELDIIDNTHPKVFAYKRTTDSKSSITVLNFSQDEVDFTFPEGESVQRWILGSYDSLSMEKPKEGLIRLQPWEGLLGLMRDDSH
jgi:glycosidase